MMPISVLRNIGCVLSLMAVFLALSGCEHPSPLKTTLNLANCRIHNVDSPAHCAMLTVPEDYTQGDNGKTIQIHIAVLPAIARSAEPDPLYLFAGGPGQAASDLGRLAEVLGNVRRSRDIVLVDQRGTGKSETLSCDLRSIDPKNSDPVNQLLSHSAKQEANEWSHCIATLKGNAATHRTDDYIDDLERVRHALGHGLINVWGGSYGSRVALRYMKRYPRSLRSVVLDGVAPTAWRLPDNALQASETQLRDTLSACEASPACQNTFPDLLARFDRLLKKLDKAPQTVSLSHPATGKLIHGNVSSRTLVSLLWQLLYSPESERLIPQFIAEAERDHFAPLISIVSAQSMNNESIAIVQRFAVMCAEDMLGRQAPANPRFQVLTDLFYGFCKNFPHGRVAAEFFEPTQSDIPTLLLSGSLDPVTPPAQAEQAARTLSQHKLITVSGMGHIVTPQSCIRRIIEKFIKAGTVSAANAACEAELSLPRPLFYVSPLEARP